MSVYAGTWPPYAPESFLTGDLGPAVGATVEVFDLNTGLPIILYTDRLRTSTRPNPFTINDPLALVQFCADPGEYRLVCGALNTTIRVLSDFAEPFIVTGVLADRGDPDQRPGYFATDDNAGTLYAGGAAWQKASPGLAEFGGTEIDYAEIAVSSGPTSSTTILDVTGASVDIPDALGRPIFLHFYAPLVIADANSSRAVLWIRDSANVKINQGQVYMPTTPQGQGGNVWARLGPNTTGTFKGSIQKGAGGNSTYYADNTTPSLGFLRAFTL